MPAPSTAGSLSTRITGWLQAHDGFHRPAQIAAGLGIPDSYLQAQEAGQLRKTAKSQWTLDVGRECSRMFARGHLVRQQVGALRTGGGVRASTYSLPQQ